MGTAIERALWSFFRLVCNWIRPILITVSFWVLFYPFAAAQSPPGYGPAGLGTYINCAPPVGVAPALYYSRIPRFAIIQQLPNMTYICQSVSLDASVEYVPLDDLSIVVRARATRPPHTFRQVLTIDFRPANQVEPVSSPPGPYDGAAIWCSTTPAIGSRTWAVDVADYVPALVIEVRNAEGSAVPIVRSTGAYPDSALHKWTQAHPACGGLPGLSITGTQDNILDWRGNEVFSTLASLSVTGLL